MKIQQLKFIEHPVFPTDSTLTFFQQWDTNIPKLFFIVGNNWAWKTHILESLYYWLTAGWSYGIEWKISFTTLTPGWYEELESTKNDRWWYPPNNYKNIGIIYNNIDIDFSVPKIKSVTASGIDEKENPQEKSEKLSSKIPQLLIDLKAQDDSSRSKRMEENPTKTSSECNIIKKFDRFKNAFEEMYNWSKTFKEIRANNWWHEIIFNDINWSEVSINNFSTGEKQILFRIWDILRNLNQLQWAIILIDEPETSLHPVWQKKFIQFILDIFDWLDVQIIIATHSPYILQGLKIWESICIKLDKNNGNPEIGEKIWYYPHSLNNPSINLINYLAYWIYDVTLHIELYIALEIKSGKYKQHELSTRINQNKWTLNISNKTFNCTQKFQTYNPGDTVDELLPICIRNKINHPWETARPNYTEEELEESIIVLLELLK